MSSWFLVDSGPSDGGSSSRVGDVSRGHCGVNWSAISDMLARSAAGRSAAGGRDVNEAAMNMTVMPSPTSTSTNQRTRGGAAGVSPRRRELRKFMQPSARRPPKTKTSETSMAP
jgi:hypothetical protein